MGSYIKAYLDDSNELMRLLFEEISKKHEYNFSNFVEKFMNSRYREMLDIGSTRIINMTYDELINYLKKDNKILFKKGNYNIDSLKAGWIGVIYNMLQFELSISSKEIYKKLPLSKIMKYFIPYHTISEDLAVEKIIKAEFN